MLLVQPGAGANAATVSTSNETYPTQWDSAPAATGAGSTHTYDNAHIAHGFPTAQKMHFATVASVIWCGWKTSLTGSPYANIYAHWYMYLTAFPAAAMRLGSFLSGSSALCGAVQFTAATGLLRTVNSSGSTVATTVAAVPLNQWVRVEFEITGIVGSTGTIAARMYSGSNLEGTTADTNGSVSTAAQAVTGTANEFRLGTPASVTHATALDLWLQDTAISDTAMPAPVWRRPPLTVVLQAVSRASNW